MCWRRDIAGPMRCCQSIVCKCLPPARDSVRRLGLISLREMLNALIWSIENRPNGVRILEVPQICQVGRSPNIQDSLCRAVGLALWLVKPNNHDVYSSI